MDECTHGRSVTYSGSDEFRCTDCDAVIPDPRGCRHFRIDNTTWKCRECGEVMLSRSDEVEIIEEYPNAAACTNPDCSGDIDDPVCGNPTGRYVPDTSRSRIAAVVHQLSYRCARCPVDGDMVWVNGQIMYGCGRSHRGDAVWQTT